MKETELAQKFAEYLSDYNLYFEVPNRGSKTDIVAVKEPVVIAIEVKTSFGLAVIEQADFNRRFYHYSYVAVPSTRGGRLAKEICYSRGIGVMSYSQFGYNTPVIETVRPMLNRKARPPQLIPEYQKNIPGCQSGDSMTAFKATVLGVCKYLSRKGPTPLAEVLENINYHYHSVKAAKAGLYQWMRNGVIKEFELKEDRKVHLTNEGLDLIAKWI